MPENLRFAVQIGIFFAPLVLIVPFVIWFYRRIGFRRGKAVVAPVVLYLVVAVSPSLLLLLEYGPQREVLEDVLQPLTALVSGVLLLVAGISLLHLWRPEVLAGQLPDDRAVELQGSAIRRALDSAEFLTALNESLPRGKTDAEHGLDYIPYLLQAVRLRRERFADSSRRFLRLTLAMGLISAAVVTGFGVVLLADASVGAPRALADVREASVGLAAAVKNLTAEYRSTSRYQAVEASVKSEPGNDNHAVQGELLRVLRAEHSTPRQLHEAALQLRKISTDLVGNTETERIYRESVVSALAEFERWTADQMRTVQVAEATGNRLSQALPKLEAELGTDHARVAELLRRLAIGVVVVTFLLVLVRFFSNLYRTDYMQVLRAEMDDMFVRSFYVAYRAADTDQQKASAVAALVTAMSALPAESRVTESVALSKEHAEILKEIVAAVAKKV